MKALSTLKSAIDHSSFVGIIALILLIPVLQPQLASAAALQTSGQSTAQIFEINVSDSSLLDSAPKQNNLQNSITFNDIQAVDPLTVNLQAFLQDNNSPLQGYTSQLLSHDNWKTILAISFVESNMCIHDYRYNCSGIGGQEYLRKYNDFGEWIDDMSSILATRYNGWTLDKMNGVYVQPKSVNWAFGSKKIFAQLTELENFSNLERSEIARTSAVTEQSNRELATIAQ
jgi:hypothetical protein